MDATKRKKLKKLGGRVTTVKELLGLDEHDVAAIEARLTMAAAIRKGRMEAGLTQAELARRIGSSQARVARMESGDPQASLESMMRALTAIGYRTRVTVTRARAA
jgi:predicted transcriptional regulator